jgi:hypothetical protein
MFFQRFKRNHPQTNVILSFDENYTRVTLIGIVLAHNIYMSDKCATLGFSILDVDTHDTPYSLGFPSNLKNTGRSYNFSVL